MAVVLAEGNDSYFIINGVPYQRGSIVPLFEADLLEESRNPAVDYEGYVSFRREVAFKNNMIGNYHYSSYTNAATGLPFADFNELLAWIGDNCFLGTAGGGGTTGLAYTKTFYIKAVPVAPNEKAPGATFSDAWLDGATPTLMLINNADYTGAQITYNDGTDSIGPTGSEFVDGDTVVIFKS